MLTYRPQRTAAQPQLQNGNAGSVILHHSRRKDAWRHDAQNRLVDGNNLRDRKVDACPGLQIHADQADAVVGGRLDVLDVADGGGHRTLGDGEDPLRHIVRAHAVVRPDDADHRDVDVRKYIGRHGDDRNPAQDGNQQRHHDEGIWAPQREPDNPHSLCEWSNRTAIETVNKNGGPPAGPVTA